MKHNNMRDDEAQHAYEKKLSRNPVTLDSVPEDGYRVRYEQAMNLLGMIYNPYAWDNTTFADLIKRIDAGRERYKKLRDSE